MSDQSVHVVVLTGAECSDCGIVAWLSKVLEAERSGGRSFTLRGELDPERLRLELAAAGGNARAAEEPAEGTQDEAMEDVYAVTAMLYDSSDVDDALAAARRLAKRFIELRSAAKEFYDDIPGCYHENRDRLGAILYPTA